MMHEAASFSITVYVVDACSIPPKQSSILLCPQMLYEEMMITYCQQPQLSSVAFLSTNDHGCSLSSLSIIMAMFSIVKSCKNVELLRDDERNRQILFGKRRFAAENKLNRLGLVSLLSLVTQQQKCQQNKFQAVVTHPKNVILPIKLHQTESQKYFTELRIVSEIR